MIPKIVVMVGPLALVACGNEASFTDEQRSATAQRGLGGSESGSCVGLCGAWSPEGCWCDEECERFGDCCPDRAEACDGFEPTCERWCGGRTPWGCWCDEGCESHGDCCPDKLEVCDPCYGVVCETPPEALCIGGDTLRSWSTTGVCVDGTCVYEPLDTSCADDNPCTLDTCHAAACTHITASLPVYRSYNQYTGAHAYSLDPEEPAGWRREGIAFESIAVPPPGAKLIYQHVHASTDRMLSLNPNEGAACCGYTNGGDLGYGFSEPGPGLVPIYRLLRTKPPHALHLSSRDPAEGTICCDYLLEGTGFYACPPQ